MPRPASPQAAKPSRRFLGCGCSTWLWTVAALLILLVLIGLLGDPDSPAAEAPAAVPIFTDTPAPLPTATTPPTDTSIPPPAAIEQRAAPVVPIVPVAPAAPAAALSDCPCDSDTLNCGDFAAFDAQSCYLRCLELTGRDVHGLDGNNDGTACEWE